MTIAVELEEPTLSHVRREAERLEVEPQEVVKELVEQAFPQSPILTPEQQFAARQKFVACHAAQTPVLSEYAMSRESFYEHEGRDKWSMCRIPM